MPRRTYEKSGRKIEKASDLDEAVKDKRAEWRASPSKERRRKRRYEKRLTKELLFREERLTFYVKIYGYKLIMLNP